MAIEIIYSKANPQWHSVTLDVSYTGLDITVHAGSFLVEGQSYDLLEDQTYTVQADGTYNSSVWGYLVQDVSDSSIHVLVDRVLDNGADVFYKIDGSLYKSLARLWTVEVAAGATDLESTSIRVLHKVDFSGS